MDIYVVVQPDLAPGLKCAQVAHAVAGLVNNHPNACREATFNGRMIVVDGPPIDSRLTTNFIHYTFHEPDLDDWFTATAFLVPDGWQYYFSGLKLAYSKKKWWRFWK